MKRKYNSSTYRIIITVSIECTRNTAHVSLTNLSHESILKSTFESIQLSEKINIEF